ncbi:MAG: hypothetical protein V7L20_01825 [Nostoc sp.]|uniref:hypothetical protein n=1 Tax=Nostoc sp. TaxID=1180 RepID=UPI002FFC58B4
MSLSHFGRCILNLQTEVAAFRILLELTQNISQTLKTPCRASCFSQGETLREQVGEPQGRTGFSAPLRFIIP